jgi:4-carboxymuconolactone decarboxylase
MDRRAQGQENFTRLFGERFVASMAAERNQKAFGWSVADHSIESCFASIWGREGLDWRSRSMVSIAMLIVLGDPAPLKTYVRVGLRTGVTIGEIEEIIVHAIPYVGYSRAGAAVRAAREALADDSIIPAPSGAVRAAD